MNSSAMPTPANSLRRTVWMYLIIGISALGLAACLLGVIGLLTLMGTNRPEALALCLGIVATLSGVFGLLLLIVFVAAYPQAAEVDGLLAGKTLIAHWRYAVDEQNQPKAGYVYIGPKGVYKDGPTTGSSGAAGSWSRSLTKRASRRGCGSSIEPSAGPTAVHRAARRFITTSSYRFPRTRRRQPGESSPNSANGSQARGREGRGIR